MEIDKDYLTKRIAQLETALDNTHEKLMQISGAIQEAKFMMERLNEKEKQCDGSSLT